MSEIDKERALPPMLKHLIRAAEQLSDPAVAGTVLRSVLMTIGLFLALLAGCFWLIGATDLFQIGWMEWVADIAGGLLAMALAWVMFPAVVLTISSLLLERVVTAVERRWYPGLGPARPQPVVEGILNAAKFFATVVLLNLIALPLYFFPILGQAAFYSVNGYLIGREYYELVAARRLDPDRMRYLRSEASLRLFVVGAIIAFLSTLPFVNLLVPIVAAAFMVHVFEEMRQGLPPPGTA
ncbi:MAG: hypothetical protein RLY86_2639 [Pseudomonadota bacterium]|jgi:uncharacterized protein involved in cysteine biosynthesis